MSWVLRHDMIVPIVDSLFSIGSLVEDLEFGLPMIHPIYIPCPSSEMKTTKHVLG